MPWPHPRTPATMATDELPSPNWLELPREIATTILLKLGAVEILTTAQQVCTSWRSLCLDPAMWQSIDMRIPGDFSGRDHDLVVMCCRAVDRSRGGCVDLNIENFATDELLKYVADRCNHIRRLQLVHCNNISDEGLSGAAKKLPFLEVLELSYCSYLKQALETVGQYCPLLKSLKLNSQGYIFPHGECDDQAQAIAKNMHELRDLHLFANKMTNEGLMAILNSCPHLEYLDLRQCFNIVLEGDLGKRCDEQIKVLRRQYEDYDFDATLITEKSFDDYNFDATLYDEDSSDDDYPYGISFSDYYDYYDKISDYDEPTAIYKGYL